MSNIDRAVEVSDPLIWVATVERLHPHTLTWQAMEYIYPRPGQEAEDWEVRRQAECTMSNYMELDPDEQWRVTTQQITQDRLDSIIREDCVSAPWEVTDE